MSIEIYLFDSEGVACNRQCPLVTNMPNFYKSTVIRKNESIPSDQISGLELGDVIISTDTQDADGVKKTTIYYGIVAFENVHQSRISNISVSKTINDLLLLNANSNTDIKLYAKNDFRTLKNGLTIFNNLDYVSDILYEVDTDQFKIQLF